MSALFLSPTGRPVEPDLIGNSSAIKLDLLSSAVAHSHTDDFRGGGGFKLDFIRNRYGHTPMPLSLRQIFS